MQGVGSSSLPSPTIQKLKAAVSGSLSHVGWQAIGEWRAILRVRPWALGDWQLFACCVSCAMDFAYSHVFKCADGTMDIGSGDEDAAGSVT